jgi:hypothetical protein
MTALTPKRPYRRQARTFSQWRSVFLAALADSANVRAACEAAGISRETAYHYREKNEAFRAEWETAIQDACDTLEEEAWKRACTTSDVLLIFLLKAHRPALYRETIHHRIDITQILRQVAEADGLDPDEVVRAAEAIATRIRPPDTSKYPGAR